MRRHQEEDGPFHLLQLLRLQLLQIDGARSVATLSGLTHEHCRKALCSARLGAPEDGHGATGRSRGAGCKGAMGLGGGLGGCAKGRSLATEEKKSEDARYRR
eukprot:scaffold133681_cov19-Tisochrysis_lutea.AAC.1